MGVLSRTSPPAQSPWRRAVLKDHRLAGRKNRMLRIWGLLAVLAATASDRKIIDRKMING
jgi:hypothetical protein